MSEEPPNARFVSFTCGCAWIDELDTVAPLSCPQHDAKRQTPPVLTWVAKGTQLGVKAREYFP